VQDNTELLTTNVDRLADITLVLVQQRRALGEVLDVAPAALSNLARAYNPDYGTLDTRDNGLASQNPELLVCAALAQLGRIEPDDLPVPIDPVDVPVVGDVEIPPLETTTESICARLLSGDANADGDPDNLDGNTVDDIDELWGAIFGGAAPGPSGGSGGGGPVAGLPPVGGAS
jgi:hypothetical protein